MRSIGSDREQALLMRYVCSMYSVILCKKLRGSLKTMGIVIFDSSCEIEHPLKSSFYISGENIFSLLMGFVLHFSTDAAPLTQ